MEKVTSLEAYFKVKESEGKIFTVEFVKKDGSVRKMNCRLGVSKDVKGVGLKFDPVKKRLLPVYDMQKMAYRMINLNALKTIAISGNKYEVEG